MNTDLQASPLDDTSWMWAGKLAPPNSQLEVLARPGLLDNLDGQLPHAVVLVSAPPGFGKTTLLAQWRHRLLQVGQPAAWVSLDEADREQNRFLAYIVLALHGAGVPLAQLSELARRQTLDANSQHTLSRIVAALANHAQRVVLVLDDFHRASSPATDEIVTLLIERASQWLQIVLACRGRPRLRLATLQSRGLLQELAASDLALTAQETALVMRLAQGGPMADDDALAELVHRRTEGWPVAVQLTRLWLARGGRTSALSEFSGRVDNIAQYLTEQVVDTLPEDCRAFMLETALLERFDALLADEVRGRKDSRELLNRLAEYRTLLVPLDAQNRWYRYNLLLSDLLESRLDADRARQVHSAAARWLGRQGDCLLAVRHALRAEDRNLAVELVAQAGGWELVLRRGIAYTQSLLKEFDELTTRSDTTLLLIQAYLHAKLGNEPLALELLRLARAGAPVTSEYQVVATLVNGYFDHFELNDSIDDLLLGPALTPLGKACLFSEKAAAALSRGALPEVNRSAQAALVQMQVAGSPLGEAYVLLHDAQAHSLAGNVFAGRARIDDALKISEKHFGTESSLRSLVGCMKAQHLYWTGHWSEANEWARAADITLEGTDAWTEVLAPNAEVSWRTQIRTDGMRATIRRLDLAAEQARQRHLPRMTRLIQAWRVDLLVQCGHGLQAQQEATAAELESNVDSCGWREREAIAMALARLRADKGAQEQAVQELITEAANFHKRGLVLCAWRLEALAWALRRRELDSAIAQESFRHWMQKIWAQSLAGLVLEAGHGTLAWLYKLDDSGMYAAWPGLSALITKLRGWQAHPPRLRASFSAKEMQVMTLVSAGHSNKEAARVMDVSENTVKFHLKQIFQKLGVDNRAAAIAVAFQQGFIQPR